MWCLDRLVAAMFPIGENVPLSTCISGPIRVLANNDVPSGAAFIPLVLETEADWDGWRACADLQPRLAPLYLPPYIYKKIGAGAPHH